MERKGKKTFEPSYSEMTSPFSLLFTPYRAALNPRVHNWPHSGLQTDSEQDFCLSHSGGLLEACWGTLCSFVGSKCRQRGGGAEGREAGGLVALMPLTQAGAG